MRTRVVTALALAAVPAVAPAGSTSTLAPVVYRFRPDLRDCLSPVCGGYWLKAVDRPQTTCLDGSKADRCYVAEIDWAGAGWTPDEVTKLQSLDQGPNPLLYGPVEGRDYGAAGTFGVLLPERAWTEFPRSVP